MRVLVLSGLLIALLQIGCRSRPSRPAEGDASVDSTQDREVSPQPLPLSPPLNRKDIEISGLAWYGDTLVVLPQYPSRRARKHSRQVYGLPRPVLHRAVADSAPAPLEPIPIPLEASGITEHASAYEGCEAIAFTDEHAYLLIEGKGTGSGMRGHLLRGRVAPGLEKIRLWGRNVRSLPQQAALPNMSYEALLIRGDTVITIFEANGAYVNASPRAYQFSRTLRALGSVPFPTLEYRVTDATTLDGQRRFWVINYFYPGDRDFLDPARDSLARRFGEGKTHRTSKVVERLVEYRYTPQGIRRTERAPIWFELRGGTGRNWEGVVRFEDGFLVATDKFPRTLLAYVPDPRR